MHMRKRLRKKKRWIVLLNLYRVPDIEGGWCDYCRPVEIREYSQRKKTMRQWAELYPYLNERRDIFGREYTSVIADLCYVTEAWNYRGRCI